ncbi:hypothetical protein [Tropicimonas sp. IMCC34011]|uniref:hypothetical protein n=1 Tax=Tropicimonas sp. IMCC34011 TaxID=2248759 RepID=UPI001300B29D|nr:hypothetical protein [Tropicimonas sp. IMCC34011]
MMRFLFLLGLGLSVDLFAEWYAPHPGPDWNLGAAAIAGVITGWMTAMSRAA